MRAGVGLARAAAATAAANGGTAGSNGHAGLLQHHPPGGGAGLGRPKLPLGGPMHRGPPVVGLGAGARGAIPNAHQPVRRQPPR